MKIAFTSCVDVLDDDTQSVWFEVRNHRPDVLLLLGDIIYMDFGKSFLPRRWRSDHPLNKPRGWDDQTFANEMYRRYLAQSKVESFRALLNSVQHVGTIWDDHDFAWNNTCGMGNGKNVVPQKKKLISRGLHLQFREWSRKRPLPNDYPTQPDINDLLTGPDKGIEEVLDLESVRFLMSDGRYYREPKTDDESSMMLGEKQRNWLAQQLSAWPNVCILCTGSTLKRGKESWDEYSDLEWLAEQRLKRTDVVLSGDIHKNAAPTHKDLGGIRELTASGAARPKLGGASGNFGILAVEGNELTWTLFDDEGPEIRNRSLEN